jgi:hypothetical protein
MDTHNRSIHRLDRWSQSFAPATKVETVRFISPSGRAESRPVFAHQAAEFKYDPHGYEEMTPAGPVVLMVRFSPQETGEYHYQALRGGIVAAEGSFSSLPSDHPGFVTISQQDPRYFACSNGESYCPIGLNLCSPPQYLLPQGMAHFETGSQYATLGLREYERWFRLLAQNGGNFTRIWLSNPYLAAETEIAGEVDLLRFNRLDGLVELARAYGIRLKLCFDHFRVIDNGQPTTQPYFLRKLRHPRTTQSPAGMDEWLSDPAWQDLWFQKVQAYLARYAGDPIVMAWELWNEMDCVETSRWDLVRDWTALMLRRIKAAAPDQLVVQSLGSFDDVAKFHVQDDLKAMPEMDFQQVHRYLDQGAPWEVCTLDPVQFSLEAVQQTRRPDRPVLLAETGAVNDRHTGLFRYCRMDDRGIIFHDTTFPAFFAGAAGTGQEWFWDRYVDEKNCWGQFRAFADLLAGVSLDQEGFTFNDRSNDQAWCLALEGRRTWLLWIRSKADRWDKVLRDGQEPAPISTARFALPADLAAARLSLHASWPEDQARAQASIEGSHLVVSGFSWGVMVKLTI